MHGQRRHAEDRMPGAVSSKVHQGAKGIACSPVVHARHDGAQVRKLRLLNQVAHCNCGAGQLAPSGGILHATAQRRAVQPRRAHQP